MLSKFALAKYNALNMILSNEHSFDQLLMHLIAKVVFFERIHLF